MRRAHRSLMAGLVALAWVGCSEDDASGPGPEPTSPDVILSDPITPGSAAAAAFGSGAATVAFVSLAPGTVPEAEFVIIRNVTAGDVEGLAVPVEDGGFDPVVILAEAEDRLELELHDEDGNILVRKYGAVPRSRPPSIVRVSPPPGRTDVALAVRPTVIFSEPVDPASLPAGVRLLRGGVPVDGQAFAPQDALWTAEFIPDDLLAPGTAYELDVAATVRDLDGSALPTGGRFAFTTGSLTPPPPPPPPPPGPTPSGRIAFVSTRHGGPWIYVANADGSGVVPLVNGEAPAWSADGLTLAFNRGYELRVINADGTGERVVAAGAYEPSWSPDGTRLAYHTGAWGSIHTVNADGTGDVTILDPETLGPEYLAVGQPAWSPDGQSIAFTAEWYADDGVGEIWVIDADGSNPRMIEGTGPGGDPYLSNGMFPAWSPDGTTIAFQTERWIGGPFLYMVATRLADGTGSLTVHFNSYPTGMMPSPIATVDWSPDGQMIAFERWSAESVFPHRIQMVHVVSHTSGQLVSEATGGVVEPYRDSEITWSRVGP